MGVGGAVRRRLGRFEIPAADLYRGRFINLEDLAATLASLGPAKRIMEIGCGDGTLAQRLVAAFPDAEYVGVDVAPTPGRLFRGDRSRVSFHSMPSGDYLAAHPDETFDLVVVVDVLHHVPEAYRIPLLRDAATLAGEHGLVAVKDWERGHGLPHLMAYTADRYVSGDKTVRFPSREELRAVIAEGLPGLGVVLEARIPPRRNNVLRVLRRDA
jgi:2-polyprenyl-6-hydroxyphenyl methylase/3-demethylubiquinone-9 3-methyltransferase